MSNYDLFGDYEPEQPATLEEDKPEPEPQPPRRRPPRRRKKGGGGFYNLLAALFVLATAGICVVTVLLIRNPTLPFNPFPPPSPYPTPTLFLLGGGSSSGNAPPSPTLVPATRVPTTLPRVTQPPQVTASATLQLRPTGLTALPGGTNTVSIMPFTIQNEAVTYSQNTNNKGCAWLSIAGQVFDIDGNPLPGLPVRVTGENFDWIAFTGTAPQFGPSGYEVYLNSTPIEAEFLVQLLNTTGEPLSEPVVVRTISSCDGNVAIANFIQNHPFSP